MQVLVTGGAGYVGSVVAAQLVAAGHAVTVLDDLSTGHRDAVPDGVDFVEADITAVGDVFAARPVEAVVHFAAKSVVPESMREPAAYWRSNVAGSLALFDAMRAHRVDRIVFSSSAAVYGNAEEVPIPESAPARPTSPYGATKLAIDLALADYAQAYDFAAVSLRYFNVAGALLGGSGRFGERHTRETHLIPLALRAAAGQADKLSLFGTDYPTPDGTCIRDYIHVVDLGIAHLRALEFATPGRLDVVNLGSGRGYSVREVLRAVEKISGHVVPVTEAGRRAGDPPVLVASVRGAQLLLDWRPERDLELMVADAWEFVRPG
jgi:UDP-glucose 4-epimerase